MHKKSKVTVKPLDEGIFKITVEGSELHFIEEDKLEDENGEPEFLITIGKNDYGVIAKITDKEVLAKLYMDKEDKLDD